MVLAFSGAVFGDDQVADFTGAMSDTVEITVENAGFSYIPQTIKVREGTTVILTFVNTGGYHDWVVDEFDASTKQIGAGKSDTIEFVADQVGTFEFYCSVIGHRKKGMWGNFIVVES